MSEKEPKVSKSMPEFPESYWRDSISLPSFPKLSNDIEAEIGIVGGGISGITTAYLLAKEGLNVVLLEAGELLNGTTGHTTAKITAQHDIIYDELISHFGEEKSRLYYKANDEALQFIKRMVEEHEIDCDLSEQDAYIYTDQETSIPKLEKELEAYRTLGINGEWVDQIALPIPIKGAIVMKKQAQFHPLKYLNKLVQLFVQHGGKIYEQTTVNTVEEGDKPVIVTEDNHRVTCQQIVSCSHFPFHDGMSLYFARLHSERSYVIGVKSDKHYLGGMYISAEDPKRSVRSTPLSTGEELLIISGESHKTGQGICTIEHYEALETFANQTFGINEFSYRWSTQDLVTLDKVPYVGHMTSDKPNMYVATGYRKWGMSNGTAAALLLSDLIRGKENPYQELYSPSRFHADPDIKTFLVQNVDVAKHLIEGKLEFVRKSPEDLENDEGSVVTVNGKRAGAYRDGKGKLHIVDTTCTHMGCEVEWNHGERSWDCPCHGSRFSYDGEVLEGPAKRPLPKLTSS